MKRLFFLFVFFCSYSGFAQSASESIQLNQVGFYPNALKRAVIMKGSSFVIVSGKDTVFRGKTEAARINPYSKKESHLADFSAFKKPGTYQLVVPEIGASYPFKIQTNVHLPIAKAGIKMFYYNRVSTALSKPFAGKWARPAGHSDAKVIVHPSAASKERPAGTVISSPGGWYDAGDYNKYIVNSGITVGTLLSLYEDYPAYVRKLVIDIPEKTNAIPDLLDEVLVNLRWMLTMQDPHDGGVYHKLTNAKFDGMIMPHEAKTVRYVVQKSTAATLDFAAVMAQAARVFKPLLRELPGLSDSCRVRAVQAWNWAKEHPKVLYEQEEINRNFDPDVSTGTYGDRQVSDEWIWASAELYALTKDKQYRLAWIPEPNAPLPSWNQVRTLGYYTLTRLQTQLPEAAQTEVNGIRNLLLKAADDLIANYSSGDYATVMGQTAKDFSWGSSSVAANQGIALLHAYRLRPKKEYLEGALSNLDYLLGRNATGYCFLTGAGSKSPLHPHHRLSEADGVPEPVPGMLSGGPNPGQQDKCPTYPNQLPNESFTDEVCSYASNEIAINWNAPFVYLAVAMEALQGKFH
ncbi:cellulase [Siphonobacter sp. SORGH_AS_0500]|uniref:glycoside hydrolase family 9 protein n=1 Tax=Siphonobacter sp. SORGH_AS_0500 TaxID=1864824 RepID=UPI000CAC02BA|nr:glycoside hydrolase family 9 protein [Siphonobacter sp. SORGH_AS_0500]PKK37308.1 cellulase [Siphonobacter sp. SORGH_AS_0500]